MKKNIIIKLLLLPVLFLGWAAGASLKEDNYLAANIEGLKASSLAQVPAEVQSARQAVWRIRFSSNKGISQGTGFFISPKLLLTNFHVIGSIQNFKSVSLSQEGNSRELSFKKIIALSALHDLALIETEETVADYLELKNIFLDIKELYVLGYPKGVLTEIKNTGPARFESDNLSFMTSHFKQGGASGAPVLNQKGQVVGIVKERINNRLIATALDPSRWIISDVLAPCLKESAKDCIKKEIEKLKELAQKSNIHAQFVLSEMYFNDEVVEKDLTIGRKWLELAAKQGDAQAQTFLAQMYLNGEGVKKDFVIAKNWLELAAKQGDPSAHFSLARMYYRGEGVKKDFAMAKNYLEFSAWQGDVQAQSLLASLYISGKGIKRDFVKAKNWLELSAGQGYVLAQFLLGALYLNGEGVKKDFVIAKNWLELSAGQGHASAQFFLAQMYLNGEGVEKDLDTAKNWLELSARQGDAQAKKMLKKHFSEAKGFRGLWRKCRALFQSD